MSRPVLLRDTRSRPRSPVIVDGHAVMDVRLVDDLRALADDLDADGFPVWASRLREVILDIALAAGARPGR